MTDLIDAAAEMAPDADRYLLELTAALGEAVQAADSPNVQQEGREIHLRFGTYRVRAEVTEIVRDLPEIKAPPKRDTSLQEQRERQLLRGTVHHLVASCGARVPLAALDLSALPLESVKALRNVLRKVAEHVDEAKRLEVEMRDIHARSQGFDKRAASF